MTSAGRQAEVLRYHLSRLILPFDQWIMNKCIKNTHKGVLVIVKELHCNFAGGAENSFDTSYPKTVNEVLCESKRNSFGCFKCFALSARG